MLVLEEAHTIVPETFGAGFDYDTQWVVSRIGQIALQGRKYGVGLLVISPTDRSCQQDDPFPMQHLLHVQLD